MKFRLVVILGLAALSPQKASAQFLFENQYSITDNAPRSFSEANTYNYLSSVLSGFGGYYDPRYGGLPYEPYQNYNYSSYNFSGFGRSNTVREIVSVASLAIRLLDKGGSAHNRQNNNYNYGRQAVTFVPCSLNGTLYPSC